MEAIKGRSLFSRRHTAKSLAWVRHRGTQLPEGGSPARSSWESVVTERDIVKAPAYAAEAPGLFEKPERPASLTGDDSIPKRAATIPPELMG